LRWRLPQPNITRLPLGQAAERDVAGHGGLHDRAGGGPQAHVFIEIAQLGQRGVQVEGRVFARRLDQVFGEHQRQAADLLLGILDHHLVDACSRVAVVRLKVTGQPACACRPSAASSSTWARDGVVVAGRLQRAHGREAGAQPRFEAGQGDSRRPRSRTIASTEVWWLQRLGPRKARTRDTSIKRILSRNGFRCMRLCFNA
jgi:hypothetical protein